MSSGLAFGKLKAYLNLSDVDRSDGPPMPWENLPTSLDSDGKPPNRGNLGREVENWKNK